VTPRRIARSFALLPALMWLALLWAARGMGVGASGSFRPSPSAGGRDRRISSGDDGRE
jgi:hypothetical protein